MSSALRLSLSLCSAVALVGAVVAVAVSRWFAPQPIIHTQAFRVDIATQQEIAAAQRVSETPAERAAPTREGFVQLSFTVTPSGRAENIEVIGAMPRGVYEAKAIARIRAGRYAPARADGVAEPGRQTQIVAFHYTADSRGDAPAQALTR